MANKKFSFKVERFREDSGIPGIDKKKEIMEYTLVVKCVDIPADIPKDPNPRAQNIDKGIYKGIKEDLRNNKRAFFYYMNQGIKLLVENVGYDSRNSMVTIEMKPGDGISDGAHTYEIIRDAIVSGECPDNQYIKIIAYSGVSENESHLLTKGVNTSMQVNDTSLADNAGHYDWIKETFKGKPWESKVSYIQNDNKVFDIKEALIIMDVCDPDKFPLIRDAKDELHHPNSETCKKKACLNEYITKSKKSEKFSPILNELMWLAEHIQADSRDVCNSFKKEKGDKRPITGALRIFESAGKRGKYEFVFLNKNNRIRLHYGALYPIIGAVRMFITRKDGKLSWSIPFSRVVEIMEKSLPGLISKTQGIARKSVDFKGSDIPKDGAHWDNIFNAVERAWEKNKK